MFGFLEDNIISGKEIQLRKQNKEKPDFQQTPFIRDCRPGDNLLFSSILF